MSQVIKGHGFGDIKRSLVIYVNCRSGTTFEKKEKEKKLEKISSVAGSSLFCPLMNYTVCKTEMNC